MYFLVGNHFENNYYGKYLSNNNLNRNAIWRVLVIYMNLSLQLYTCSIQDIQMDPNEWSKLESPGVNNNRRGRGWRTMPHVKVEGKHI